MFALRFACFSCLIERVAVFAFIVKKKKLSPLLIHEVGVGAVAHFSKHVTLSFCPVNLVPHREAPLSIGLEPKQLLFLENSQVSRSRGQVRLDGKPNRGVPPSVRLDLFDQLRF